MYGLRLAGTRCPEGVERVLRESSADLESVYGLEWYRYRSARREKRPREFQKLDDPLVVRFINANDEDERLTFLERFGLPFAPNGAEPRREVVVRQRTLRRLLAAAGDTDPAIAVTAGNKAIAFASEQPLHLSLERSGRLPRLVVTTEHLLGFMYMEVAMVAANGARFATCANCGNAFLTGALTENRSTAQYCRDACRVEAYRARQKQR